MVAHAASNQTTASGLRPITSSHDLIDVSRLVERAFAGDMDESGRNAMREMRVLSQLFGWLDFFGGSGGSAMPGFVWVENGVIVGNVTVRQLNLAGHGWMIGNVAVDPAWQRRGIARQLMTAAINKARDYNARWIALQVRSDNAAARALYRSLGFEDTGETVYFEQTAPTPVDRPLPPVEGHLRAARPTDTDRLYTLAQSLVPETARWAEPLYRGQFDLGFEKRLSDRLTRTRVVWRLIETGDQLWGAASIEVNGWTRRGRLGLWVVPSRAGRIEQLLVDSVLAEIDPRTRSISARLPGDHVAGRTALITRGFRPVRALTHMRLRLSTGQEVGGP